MLKEIAASSAVLCLVFSFNALAQETSMAHVNVALNVTGGCSLVTGSGSGDLSLDFGNVALVGSTVEEDSITGQLPVGPVGTDNVLGVRCGTEGIQPRLSLVGGENDDSTGLRMANGNGAYIPYSVHTQSARSSGSEIRAGDQVALINGQEANTYVAPLYGKVTAPAAIGAPGQYTDRLAIQLTF